MSHLTNKKKKEKDKNSKKRVRVNFNTGTRNMGYKSNNDRKEDSFVKANEEE